MSRPATRGKNKRPKDKVDVTSEILRKIHATGEVSSDDVNQLYMIGKPVCQGCRVNTKDNPNCFCGLAPPPNGSRKTGLWQKMSEIVDALGPDPCKDLRESANYPAGLTNLGATCYANSILQCLYMNTSFRESLFSVEPEVLKQQPVLDQLARLFAQLHASKMAFIDSAPFIKTLELDNGVQQDSHEFLTLLLSLLERCLSHSKIAKARTVVQDLFRGRVSHVTTCSKCGKDSEASSKMEDFYELELNVKGLKSLDESLNDYLSAENLDGENQYFCDSCETRVDATRSIKLRTLPNVLNFQLKRYVFLPKTTTKKKITSAFCFPGQLDMRQRLSEHSELNWVYDLSAVLLHKGSAVNSGHYVAHIKDGKTGQWWEFDDEQVSNLGQHPFGEGSSKVSAKGVQGEPVTDLAGEGKRNGLANGNHRDDIQPRSSLSGSGCSGETFSSTDAYLLMYNLRCSRKDTEQPANPAAGNIKPEGHSDTSHDDFSLPFQMLDEIKNMNASYLEACEEYKSKKNKEVSCITERREEVRSILSEAPVQSPNETFYWISTEWLRQWADNITLPVIDNRSIQCSHGKVPVSKVNSMKRLSAGAWTRLYSKCNGGPTLSKDDHCITCLIDGAQSVVCADSYRDRRNLMKELANQVLTGNCDDGSYYVSKTWLQQWVRRKNIDSPSEADAGPASALMCPHGQLMPDRAPGAKRLLVPENLWLFFYQDATAVKPDDPMSTAVFPSDSEQCTKCSNELSEVACLESSLREEKLRHRQNHEKLATGKSIPLSLNTKYYLVPSSWLAKWRSYVNASGKNISSAEEPENLDHVIDLLRCEKHMRLLERPPELISRRGVLFQKSSQTDGLTIIAEHDWNKFCEEWRCDKLKGISVTIESNNVTDNSVDGFCKMEIDVENPSSLEEPNDEIQTVQPIIRNCPEVCEDCVGERETCELMEKLNYCNEDISVSLIRGKEPPRSILQTSETSTDPDRRASKRSRKSNSGNSVNLKVSGTTTIYQLKMMIWESLGVVKENQILHKGSKVLDKEAATLADMNIFPGDKLWVQDSEIYEHRDIADELADNKMGTDHSEEGFRGTLLMADISSHVI